jgi:hypothetical protein
MSTLLDGHLNDNTSTVTGAGYLTDPHNDWDRTSQLVIHVSGSVQNLLILYAEIYYSI